MLKRFGILTIVLAAGALLQPVAALAADRDHGRGFDRRDDVRRVETYRAPVRRDVDRDRVYRRDYHYNDRVLVEQAPGYYYAPAPQCVYGR